MNHPKRVQFISGDLTMTGVVVARRPKLRQIYIVMDWEDSRHDNWFSESAWSEVPESEGM